MLQFRLSPQANWTTLMINKGYLQSIIESILKSDSELLKILRPVPTNLKPLYVYEAKMVRNPKFLFLFRMGFLVYSKFASYFLVEACFIKLTEMR